MARVTRHPRAEKKEAAIARPARGAAKERKRKDLIDAAFSGAGVSSSCVALGMTLAKWEDDADNKGKE